MGVEALTAGHDLASEARVFVDLKHINAEVSQANAGCDIERVLPACGGLVGEAGNQVDADIGYTRCLEPEDFADAVALGVAAADGRAFAIDERLNAEADAIHALMLGFGEDGVRDLAGCGFEGDLGAGSDVKGLVERGEDAAKLRGLEQAGGSATEVDSIYGMGKIYL